MVESAPTCDGLLVDVAELRQWLEIERWLRDYVETEKRMETEERSPSDA